MSLPLAGVIQSSWYLGQISRRTNAWRPPPETNNHELYFFGQRVTKVEPRIVAKLKRKLRKLLLVLQKYYQRPLSWFISPFFGVNLRHWTWHCPGLVIYLLLWLRQVLWIKAREITSSLFVFFCSHRCKHYYFQTKKTGDYNGSICFFMKPSLNKKTLLLNPLAHSFNESNCCTLS